MKPLNILNRLMALLIVVLTFVSMAVTGFFIYKIGQEPTLILSVFLLALNAIVMIQDYKESK